MISGKLPNDTVWWLSKDGKKIWIESGDLEQGKFKEKGYNIAHDRIFYPKKGGVGELATSRLDSRRYKYAWVIKLEAILDVYPGLLEEINRKAIEEKKKKRTKTPNKKNKKIEQKIEYKIEQKIEITEPKKDIIEEHKREIVDTTDSIKPDDGIKLDNNIKPDDNTRPDNNIEIKKNIKPERSYFDISWPYVTWIKDEVEKSEDRKMIISVKDLKEKMGEEFVKMQDMRIYFGLNKILPGIGITIELKAIRRDSKIESMAVIKRV